MNILYEYKTRKNLTVTQIAERTGLHKSLVSRHLRGAPMSLKSVEAYNKGLRIPVSKLVGV